MDYDGLRTGSKGGPARGVQPGRSSQGGPSTGVQPVVQPGRSSQQGSNQGLLELITSLFHRGLLCILQIKQTPVQIKQAASGPESSCGGSDSGAQIVSSKVLACPSCRFCISFSQHYYECPRPQCQCPYQQRQQWCSAATQEADEDLFPAASPTRRGVKCSLWHRPEQSPQKEERKGERQLHKEAGTDR